jgi:hypothetical protein
MDTSRLVLSKLMEECRIPPFFLLPVIYRHERGVKPTEIAGNEPVFMILSEHQVVGKCDLLVNRHNELYPDAGRVHWRDGFPFRYFSWRFQFYTAFTQMNVAPDLDFLFEKVMHIKLEGVDYRADLGVIVKAVGARVIDLTKVGHVFVRSVQNHQYQEAFICLTTGTPIDPEPTFIDISVATAMSEMCIAHQGYSLRGVMEYFLTGKNDIEWYNANKAGTNQGGGSISGPGKGKVPGGRGGGNATGRRVSPGRPPANMDRPWKEVVVKDQGAELKALQEQVKQLTEQVSGLKLPK